MPITEQCPCGSRQLYEKCCQPYHNGSDFPQNAHALMRARYSAYVMNLPEYIIATTHVTSPYYSENRFIWKRRIAQFTSETTFQRLEILDFKEFDDLSVVTFVVHATKKNKDFTFTEKSYFIKANGQWFYRSGQCVTGRATELITKEKTKVLPLAYYGDPILRKQAEPIEEITDEIRQLAQDMIETMHVCYGAGLAAPQVHRSIRMFIIFNSHDEAAEPVVLINPKISNPSKRLVSESEGCLSIPFIREDVQRPDAITVEYTTLEGKQVIKECSGIEARIIMHENDHINGVLFIDRLTKKVRSEIDPILKTIESRMEKNK